MSHKNHACARVVVSCQRNEGRSSEAGRGAPSEDLGEGLDVTVDHLLLGGALPAGLVHDDEPVLVVAPREKRGHLRRRAVPSAAAAPGSHGGVPVAARPPRHPAKEAEAGGDGGECRRA
jgi:hypothetical protein